MKSVCRKIIAVPIHEAFEYTCAENLFSVHPCFCTLPVREVFKKKREVYGQADCFLVDSRVSQKNTFFEFRFGGQITGANGCLEATKKFQRYRSINDTWPLIFSIQGDIQGRISKIRFLAIKSCRNMLQSSSSHC